MYFNYYMANTASYKVSWNLMLFLIPDTWIISINNTLSMLGTYVLLIPLTIVVTSLLYTQSKVINMMSALFGVMGVLFIIIKEGNLNEYMDFRAVTIYHEVTFEKKMELFKNEYFKLVNLMPAVTQSKEVFFKEYLEVHSLEIMEYIKQIKSIKVQEYSTVIYQAADKQYRITNE